MATSVNGSSLASAALSAAQLDVVRALFVRMDEASYSQALGNGAWDAFCATVSGNVSSPPAFEAYRHFHNRVLTPGMPGAVLPVESLYKDWDTGQLGAGGTTGLYLGPTARHVQDVCHALQIKIPEGFDAMPDHLVLLLELHSFLAQHAPSGQASSFASAHFDWLEVYRQALGARARAGADESLADSCRFFAQVVQIVEDTVCRGAQSGGNSPSSANAHACVEQGVCA